MAAGPFERYAAVFKIPEEVLKDVAKRESGFNPLAIGIKIPLSQKRRIEGLSIQGRVLRSERDGFLYVSIYPESVRDALSVLSFLLKRKVFSFDVGLMQINYGNIRRWGLDPVLFLDPELNLMAGAFILTECLKRFSTPERALLCYRGIR